MVEKLRGNLLDADVDALVNTVNTVGVMGKGVALQFKRAFPENFKAYERACKAGDVRLGRMFVHDLGGLQRPRYIINFPTKQHWRAKSRIEDIDAGLRALVEDVRRLRVKSLALPPLGCGQGGLNWNEVFPLIAGAFANLAEVRVLVFEPAGAPAPERIKDRTERPRMTVGRASLVGLMNRYLLPGYNYLLSLLEIHKLAYLQQEAGESLKLDFKKGAYGPYADQLRHALIRIEGHFILGVGEGRTRPDTPIRLLNGAAEEAEAFLKNHPDTRARFARVESLIEGFETPYGMELLSSVHWVGKHEAPGADAIAVIDRVHAWSDRKRRLLKGEHIRIALGRLRDQDWL